MPKEKATETNTPKPARPSLGTFLMTIRTGKNLTLRQVEEGTNRVVSNAYLSQIENDRIQQPSPNMLLALADLYDIDYGNLMELAGYVTQTKTRTAGARHGRAATFADQNLTDEEEAKLLEYLGFLRHSKKAGPATVAAVVADQSDDDQLQVNLPQGDTVVRFFCDGTYWIVSGIVVSTAAAVFS